MYILKRDLKLTQKQKKFIYSKVLSLPGKERQAVYFYFWKDYSHFQIAMNLCVPVNTIPQIIEEAMLRMRRDLFDLAGEYFETYMPSVNHNSYGG